MENDYIGKHLAKDWLQEGGHRKVIGGMWDEIGELQFNYLKSQGLSPSDKLIDIGCGALRGGRHFISFLDPGNYYGFDVNMGLIEAGLTKEIPASVKKEKVVKDNFFASHEFDFPEHWKNVDVALSLSLFTHLNLNSIRLCLHKSLKVLKPGALYHSSVFISDFGGLLKTKKWAPHVETFMHKDPYHYTIEDLEYIANSSGYDLVSVSEFGHPKGQQMAVFKRYA